MSEPSRPKRWPPLWPDVTDPAVIAAITAVPRHLFVPPQRQEQAYDDIPLPIGLGQTISQPYIVALMTQALRLKPDSSVLEIGTGSGYQAAILAQITPHVWSVEMLPELAETARQRLVGLGYPVCIKAGDGRLGWPENGPFDGIIVTAASHDVPPALVAQLAEGGRLVIPVGACRTGGFWDQNLWLVEKVRDRLGKQHLAEVRFVPLVPSPASIEPEKAGLSAIRQQLDELFAGW